jgi:hypothetical protein
MQTRPTSNKVSLPNFKRVCVWLMTRIQRIWTVLSVPSSHSNQYVSCRDPLISRRLDGENASYGYSTITIRLCSTLTNIFRFLFAFIQAFRSVSLQESIIRVTWSFRFRAATFPVTFCDSLVTYPHPSLMFCIFPSHIDSDSILGSASTVHPYMHIFDYYRRHSMRKEWIFMEIWNFQGIFQDFGLVGV